ncbi:hypothetical protein [Azospirillum doebereinerae]
MRSLCARPQRRRGSVGSNGTAPPGWPEGRFRTITGPHSIGYHVRSSRKPRGTWSSRSTGNGSGAVAGPTPVPFGHGPATAGTGADLGKLHRPAGPSQSIPPGGVGDDPATRAFVTRDGGGEGNDEGDDSGGGMGLDASQDAAVDGAAGVAGVSGTGAMEGADGSKAARIGLDGARSGFGTGGTSARGGTCAGAQGAVTALAGIALAGRTRGASAAPSQEERSSSATGPVRVWSCRVRSRMSKRVVTVSCSSGAIAAASVISWAVRAAKRSRISSTASSTLPRSAPASCDSRSRSSRKVEISQACRSS